MGIFSGNDIKMITTQLSGLTDSVHLVFVKRDRECRTCRDTREIIMNFASYSDLLYVDVFDFEKDSEEIGELKIERVPALCILDKTMTDTGIRFYGSPGGYEIHSLLGAVLAVSGKNSGLPKDLVQHIQSIRTPLIIKTFVTPTCSYCPRIVRLIHKMAFLNPVIQAEMINVTGFSDFSPDSGIKGVPTTIINGSFKLEGALPEDQFVGRIKEAFQ